ncbi:MAG: RluA family pseudouridine synthase [Ruminococcus sp.]|nr:RluA family pseudouridine synthase [Ruminococcus sp.]
MRTITIGENDGGQRLDKFLSKRFRTMPKSLMYKYIRTKYIKLNGKKCDKADFIKAGDVLTLYIKDEFFKENPERDYEFLKAPDKLDVLYEDENIILIDKKPGLIVHQDKNYHFDCLVFRLQHYLYKKGEYLPDEDRAFSPALVNRIDRNTGGIVIAAKNAESLRILNSMMKNREIEKYYLCLLCGKPKHDSGIMEDYLVKNNSTNTVKIFKKPVENSKVIKTEYTLLDFNGRVSLAEIKLHTGRTHQIRAHMAFIGCPLVGDSKYGKGKKNFINGSKWQALYSYKLKFNFENNPGKLSYLNGKEFEVNDVWFAEHNKIKFNT